MASKKNVFRLIDAGRKVRRPSLVGMQFLHEPPCARPISSALAPGSRPGT
jgi:hypothetical protein